MRPKSSRRKSPVKRKPKNSSNIFSPRLLRFSLYGFLIVLFLALGYSNRIKLLYYFGFKSYKLEYEKVESKRISDVRNSKVLENHKRNAVGVDLSEYQGEVDWKELENIEDDYPVAFVFIRATAGKDRVDSQFEKNWLAAKKRKIIRGAYHYYRPNENSVAQAQLFIKTVQIQKGDLPPVLDIERLPKDQSLDSLKVGLRRWLNAVEAHYKVKPIIYTGEKYYDDFLKEDFAGYLFWIANYNSYREKIGDNWLFWQFTERASVQGIKGNVDVNIFNGDVQQLRFITME